MKNKRITSLIFFPVLVLLYVFFISPAGANFWYLLTGNGYIIPDESSVFSFNVTKMNDGSGEWWLYGYDEEFYYHYTGEIDNPYIKISTVVSCVDFNPSDVETWCK